MPVIRAINEPLCLPELFMLSRQVLRYAEDLNVVRSERDEACAALRAARFDVLLRLAAAAELKDDDTGAHLVRMGHFSAALARACGQSEEWCGRLLYASRMHDVGKIGVPDRILKKAGRLTDEEWQEMRRHPEIGAAILGGSDNPVLQMAAEVALHHHERFDGGGYPHGVAGEAIPLAARIVAVADVFDALTSDRCYRPALPVDRALGMIEHGAAEGHFDADVVAVFLRISAEVMELRAAIAAGRVEGEFRS
ncbi:Cyclic di-GMP phosphodiesterase response regulator RpfG [Azoarcus sp. Aa7]|nr:Cyclic di-GMP phosphodiesterase response regulator RpfG [Azoarcus sp. Aa7]